MSHYIVLKQQWINFHAAFFVSHYHVYTEIPYVNIRNKSLDILCPKKFFYSHFITCSFFWCLLPKREMKNKDCMRTGIKKTHKRISKGNFFFLSTVHKLCITIECILWGSERIFESVGYLSILLDFAASMSYIRSWCRGVKGLEVQLFTFDGEFVF